MSVTPFLFYLSLIFLPGILGRIILGRLLFYKQNDPFHFTVHAFVIGCLSYVGVYCFYLALCTLCNVCVSELSIIAAFSQDKFVFDFKEIVIACMLSVVLVFMISLIENKGYLSRLAKSIHISNRNSYDDVWGELFNRKDLAKHPWITIRDKKHDLMYMGIIINFSDTYRDAELHIKNVRVYKNTTAEFLYETPEVYLTLSPSEIEIEFSLEATKGDTSASD